MARWVLAIITLFGVMMLGYMVISGISQEASLNEYRYVWRQVSNNSLLVSGGTHGLKPAYPNPTQNGILNVSYSATSGKVYFNGVFLGNLDGASPDEFSVPGSIITYPSNVTYETDGNITETRLTYYSYEGCSYPFRTCEALYRGSQITYGSMFLLLMLGVMLIPFALIFAFPRT